MGEEKTVAKSHQKAGRPAPEKGPEKVIYLGPTVKDGGFSLKYGAIYSNGLPPDVAERVKSDADLAKLIVPVGKIVEVMAQLKNPDTHIAQVSNKVKATYLGLRAKKGR